MDNIRYSTRSEGIALGVEGVALAHFLCFCLLQLPTAEFISKLARNVVEMVFSCASDIPTS